MKVHCSIIITEINRDHLKVTTTARHNHLLSLNMKGCACFSAWPLEFLKDIPN